MAILERRPMNLRRIARFRSRQIEADNRQPFVVDQLHGRPRQFNRRRRKNFFCRRVRQNLKQLLVISRHCRREAAQCTDDDAKMKWHIVATPDRRRLVVVPLGAAQAAIHRPDGVRQAEPRMDV